MPVTYAYTTLDAARQALANGFADYPDADPDEIGSDMVEAIALVSEAQVGAELCRTELGWVPVGLKRLRPDIARLDR